MASRLSNSQSNHEYFDRIAHRYDDHAALEQEVCSRLLERTEFQRHPPLRILDLGCGTGVGSKLLKRKFRKAQLVSLDVSWAMLSIARGRSSLMRPLKVVCGDIGALPFAPRSADMLFSNLASYWCPDTLALFSEFRRVLRPGGMLLFSTLGPASLVELRDAWAAGDENIRVSAFPDLLEVGDALMAAGFSEPVMDMEKITLQYPSLDAMMEELEATGTSRLVRGWELWRQKKAELQAAFAACVAEGKYPLSFEIIYGTAFGPGEGQPRKTPEGDVATFSVDTLLKSRSGKKHKDAGNG
jgi:malonyl-CoA O-methyltransferase